MTLKGLRTAWVVILVAVFATFSAHLQAQSLLIPVDERVLNAQQAQLLATMRLNASQTWAYPGTQIKAARFTNWIYSPGDTVLLNLSSFFDVPDALARKVRRDDRSQGDFGWLGKGATIFDDIVLTVRQSDVVGVIFLSTDNRKIQIVPLGDGVHAVMLLRPASAKAPASVASRAPNTKPGPMPLRCGVADARVESAAPQQTTRPTPRSSTTTALSVTERNDCSVITVMAVYTRQVNLITRTHWGMEVSHWVQHGIDLANLAYKNSGIYTTLKLVHAYEEPGYVESDPYPEPQKVELDRLVNGSDGYLDDVHRQRDAHMADLVVLYTKNNAWYTGLAQGIGTGSFVHVTQDPWYLHQFVLAHEFAHLQGLYHDGVGKVAQNGAWKTMMAWANPPYDFTGWAETVPYFTNPLVTRDGVTLGYFDSFDAAIVNRLSCRLSGYKGPAAAISALVGDKDDFGSSDVPTQSRRANELIRFLTRDSGSGAMLDQMGSDRPVGFSTFTEMQDPSGCYFYPTSATLTMRVRSWDPLVYNDALSIAGLTSSPSEQACKTEPENCIQEPLLPVVALRDLLGREPSYGETHTVVLNLARVPVRLRESTGGPGGHWSAQPDEYRNVMRTLFERNFGVVLGDDSALDYAELAMTGVYPGCRPAGQKLEDMNGDGVVDLSDVNITVGGRGTKAYTLDGKYLVDPRDLDKDGMITVMDARRVAAACTYANCASRPVP